VNFLQLYRPLADAWVLCDNSGDGPAVVTRGASRVVEQIYNQELWNEFEASTATAN